MRTAAVRNLRDGVPVTVVNSPYDTEVLADSPYAYYKLDETSGTNAADSSGNNRTATIVGSPTLGATPGIALGKAVQFAGSAAYAYIRTPFTAYPASSFTIECLFKPEGSAASGELFSKRSYYATGTSDFPFYVVHQSDGKIQVGMDGGSDFTVDQTITTTNAYARNAWHHLAVVYRATGTSEVWVDGAQDGTRTGSVTLATGSRAFALGAPAFEYDAGAGGLRFQGRVDNWAFYAAALSGTRIAAHNTAYLASV